MIQLIKFQTDDVIRHNFDLSMFQIDAAEFPYDGYRGTYNISYKLQLF